MTPLLSIIIPTRNEIYLAKTIDDILAKAKGAIEIIAVLDGYWPNPPLKSDPRLIILHHGTLTKNKGMRPGINRGMAIAKGKYVMKVDGHCLFDEGFDSKLEADCEENWVVIPRRYRLDAENWKIAKDRRPPIDYNYLTYPYLRIHDSHCGLHGADWRERYYKRKKILIDDTMSCQGSCYFTTRKWWYKTVRPLESKIYGPFTQEAQEICNKTWLAGGRVVVNKKTWYAHYHKGSRGRNYGFTNAQYAVHQAEKERGRKNCIDYWINNKWPDRIHDFEWLVQKFWPIPGWPENWKEQLIIDKKREDEPSNEK